MPAKSASQYRFMAGIAHGWKPSGKKSSSLPSPSVAEEFVHATPTGDRKKWASKHKRLFRK